MCSNGVGSGENNGAVTIIGVAVAVAMLVPWWRSIETGSDGGVVEVRAGVACEEEVDELESSSMSFLCRSEKFGMSKS